MGERPPGLPADALPFPTLMQSIINCRQTQAYLNVILVSLPHLFLCLLLSQSKVHCLRTACSINDCYSSVLSFGARAKTSSPSIFSSPCQYALKERSGQQAYSLFSCSLGSKLIRILERGTCCSKSLPVGGVRISSYLSQLAVYA